MWVLFALASAFLLGFYDFFKKVSLKGGAVIPVLWANTVICSLFFIPLIICSACGVISSDSAAFVPSGGWAQHRFVMLKAVIVLSSWICGYFAIKHLPLTIVGPINSTRPVMALVGALLVFGEKLNPWQWAGVAVAITAFVMLGRSGRKEGIDFSHNRWIWLLIAAAVFGAASGLYDKYLMSPEGQGARQAVRPGMVQCISGDYNGHHILRSMASKVPQGHEDVQRGCRCCRGGLRCGEAGGFQMEMDYSDDFGVPYRRGPVLPHRTEQARGDDSRRFHGQAQQRARFICRRSRLPA